MAAQCEIPRDGVSLAREDALIRHSRAVSQGPMIQRTSGRRSAASQGPTTQRTTPGIRSPN
eukprot:4101627-Pyramimonas_sp.AAC.1